MDRADKQQIIHVDMDAFYAILAASIHRSIFSLGTGVLL